MKKNIENPMAVTMLLLAVGPGIATAITMKNRLTNIHQRLRRPGMRSVLSLIFSVMLCMTIALPAMQVASADGGDFGNIDFTAAAPSTYNHNTGGGAYNDGTIGDTNDVVEELEGGGFACGDTITYLTYIPVEAETSDQVQTIEITLRFSAKTTGQPGAAHTAVTKVAVNYGDVENGDGGTPPGGGIGVFDTDSGISDDGGSEVINVNQWFEPIGSTPFNPLNTAEDLLLTFQVTDLEVGEKVVVRIDTTLGCDPGSNPTGNLQATIDNARVVSPAIDTINVGEQLIPFKQIGDVAGAGEPLISINKTVTTQDGSCPGSETLTINQGETVKYCYVVKNSGTADLFDVEVIDDNGTPGNTGDDFPVTLTGLADLDGDADLGDLASGGTAEGFALVTLNTPGTVTNTATATGNNGRTGGNYEELTDSDTAEVIVEALQQADVSIIKTDSGLNATAGQQYQYTLTVHNAGPSDATGIVVTDTLPEGMTFVSATGATGSAEGQIVTFEPFDIAVGGADVVITITVDVAASVADGTTLTDTATADANEDDPDETNNTDDEDTTVERKADVSITKGDGVETVYAGDGVTYTYTILVENLGPSDADNVIVSDTWPIEFTQGTVTSSQGTCTASGGDFTCNLGTIASGSSATITIEYTVPPTTLGSITNKVTVTSDEFDPDETNNMDSDTNFVTQLGNGQIVPTNTNCADFKTGNYVELTDLYYKVDKNGLINNVAEGVFFYYSKITAPAESFTITVPQSDTSTTWPPIQIQDLKQVILWDDTCTKVQTVEPDFDSEGMVTLDVTGATAGETYYLSVKYDPGSLKGTSVSQTYPEVDYTFETYIGTASIDPVLISQSGDSVKVNPK